jgi:flagellar M-ring protein FliF
MNGTVLAFWKRSSLATRIGLGSAAAAIVAGAILVAVWVLQTEYQPLFTELDPRDASTIAAELDRLKTPYVIAEDGSTILVDKTTVHATRLKVMGKGIDLKGTVGFEIFNNTDFGTTEFAQKINYQRALQGELARTVAAFEEIKSARVHLVLPESGLLRRDAVRPKASVSLVMRGAQRLRSEQIQGIQRLIAASVPEMEPASVTVLDQQGVALSRRSEAQVEGEGGSGQLDAKREIETYLARKVIAVLDQAFGPGKAIVSVDVTLSYDQVKVMREEVMPAGPTRDGLVARRKDAWQRVPNGVPAAMGDTADNGHEAQRMPTSTSSEVEYQHGRKVEQVVTAPGSVRRISVGVIMSGSIEPSQAESLKQVIAMAVGINPGRGDAIAFSWVGGGAENAPHQADGGVDGIGIKPEGMRRPPSETWPPALAILLTALAALLGLIALVAWRQRRHPAAPVLSPQEREEMLAKLKRWITSGGTGPQPETPA